MTQQKIRKNKQYDRFSDELTVLGLSMAYQERDGTAPRKTVAKRALELRRYEGNAGKQQIRRTMYSLDKTVGEFRFIELISEKKNPTRIRFLKRENEAMRTISSRRFLSKHKVGNGGMSYTDVGDKIGHEVVHPVDRTLAQSNQPHGILRNAPENQPIERRWAVPVGYVLLDNDPIVLDPVDEAKRPRPHGVPRVVPAPFPHSCWTYDGAKVHGKIGQERR